MGRHARQPARHRRRALDTWRAVAGTTAVSQEEAVPVAAVGAAAPSLRQVATVTLTICALAAAPVVHRAGGFDLLGPGAPAIEQAASSSQPASDTTDLSETRFPGASQPGALVELLTTTPAEVTTVGTAVSGVPVPEGRSSAAGESGTAGRQLPVEPLVLLPVHRPQAAAAQQAAEAAGEASSASTEGDTRGRDELDRGAPGDGPPLGQPAPEDDRISRGEDTPRDERISGGDPGGRLGSDPVVEVPALPEPLGPGAGLPVVPAVLPLPDGDDSPPDVVIALEPLTPGQPFGPGSFGSGPGGAFQLGPESSPQGTESSPFGPDTSPFGPEASLVGPVEPEAAASGTAGLASAVLGSGASRSFDPAAVTGSAVVAGSLAGAEVLAGPAPGPFELWTTSDASLTGREGDRTQDSPNLHGTDRGDHPGADPAADRESLPVVVPGSADLR